MTLPIIRPDVTFEEVAGDIETILTSGMLTGGQFLMAFERAVADAVGVAHAVATTSATTALHLALLAQGVKAGDEVLVSDFTFPASGNAVAQIGAIPVLVDSLPESFAIDLADAEAKLTERTAAIMPVHPFGQPANMSGVSSLASTAGIVVVEDAACALGSSRDGQACGSTAPGAFSFHPRKVVTTGEGGAVTTNDDELADRLRLLRNHGGRASYDGKAGLDFVEHGFNYRLPEVSAAIGLTQMRRLDEILADRALTASRYEERLRELEGVELRSPGLRETWSYQSFVIVLEDRVDRDLVIASMRSRGIETTLGTYAMHAQPAFRRYGYTAGDLPNSWRGQCQSLTLPLLPRMEEGDVERVVMALASAVLGAMSA